MWSLSWQEFFGPSAFQGLGKAGLDSEVLNFEHDGELKGNTFESQLQVPSHNNTLQLCALRLQSSSVDPVAVFNGE